jgi:dTDP-4-amino-4,6-dideoxygalactose transaminase
LGEPSLWYCYLARNGIYALAHLWKLAGQEILFPAYFHGVELETLLAAGVKLRFYPVHNRMQVDVEEIRAAITPKTRAIYLIHYLGFPGPVEELSALCQARGLFLIEDCALALLSRRGDKPLGSFGDAAVFCLYKTLPVPNGGALRLRTASAGPLPAVTRPAPASTIAYTATAVWRNMNCNPEGPLSGLVQKMRYWAKARADSLRIVQVGSDHFEPDQADLGMSRVVHRILAAQDFQHIVDMRRRNYECLLRRLADLSPPVFDELPQGVCPLFYPLRTGNKLVLLDRLLRRGIQGVNFWSQTPEIVPAGAFPEVDELRRTILELPCHQDLSVEAMDRIADEVRAAWREV